MSSLFGFELIGGKDGVELSITLPLRKHRHFMIGVARVGVDWLDDEGYVFQLPFGFAVYGSRI